MTTIRMSDLVSLAWSYTSSRVVDYYRHYFSEVVTVTTKSGPVKGYKIASAFDYNYINFHGIPYAKPPIGELRFKVYTILLSIDCDLNGELDFSIRTHNQLNRPPKLLINNMVAVVRPHVKWIWFHNEPSAMKIVYIYRFTHIILNQTH